MNDFQEHSVDYTSFLLAEKIKAAADSGSFVGRRDVWRRPVTTRPLPKEQGQETAS